MSKPIIGKNQCVHGALARKCEICELERENGELRLYLKQAMEYLEATDGTRGKLVGCAVSMGLYNEWVKALVAGRGGV